MNIIVLSHEEASELLANRTHSVTHVVSLLSPNTDRGPELDNFGGPSLYLDFDDVSEAAYAERLAAKFGYVPPAEEHVKDIIAFAYRIAEDYVKNPTMNLGTSQVLFHCAAGVSRSTAAAIITATTIDGPGSEESAVREIFANRDVAWPNALMIAHADKLLAREGALVSAVEKAKQEKRDRHNGFLLDS